MCPAVAEHRVQLGSQRIRVWIHGAGDGPPLLFLNGLGAPLELWDPLLHRLPGVRAIAFDAPGSGGSEAPGLPMSIGGHARLALALLDQLGCRGVDVIGLSFGGMVAQELAHVAPTRVGRLVLASTSCGWGSVPGCPAAWLAITTPARYYSRAVFETVAGHYIGGRESANRDFVNQQAQIRTTHPPSALGYMYQFWAAAFWSSLYWLPELTQPTLVLAGEADPLMPPSNAKILATLLPQAQKHIVPGGGHLCLLEQAARLAPMIEQFLRRPGIDPATDPAGLPAEGPPSRLG
jgi:poly(3-hydroxyoctanoate) depolymerase